MNIRTEIIALEAKIKADAKEFEEKTGMMIGLVTVNHTGASSGNWISSVHISTSVGDYRAKEPAV